MFQRFGFGHAARATPRGTHRVSCPDTRVNLYARGCVGSPRIAVVTDTFSLPFAPVSVKSRMACCVGQLIPPGRRELLVILPGRTSSHATTHPPVRVSGIRISFPISKPSLNSWILVNSKEENLGRRQLGELGSPERGQYLVNNVNNLAHDTRHFASLRAC